MFFMNIVFMNVINKNRQPQKVKGNCDTKRNTSTKTITNLIPSIITFFYLPHKLH